MSAVGKTEPTDPKPRKKLSLLIIQVGDSAEVYRSLMALKAIKFLYPEVALHVIARNECAEPLRHVEWLDSVIATPKVSGGDQAVASVARWIEQVIHQNYDILANWTASPRYQRMAAIATSLIPALVKVGDYIRDDMTISSFDAWSMYRNAWMNEAIDQDIHTTDVITTQLLTLLQIHAGDPAEDQSLNTVTSKYFFNVPADQVPESWANRPKKMKWIGVNTENAPERTPEWIDMVLRRHPDTGFVLLGGGEIEGEWTLNPRVIQFEKPLSFAEKVNVTSQCQWFFSAPHAWAEFAALLNVRVFFQAQPSAIELSLKWTEEGPYGNGHIVLVPREEWKSEIAYATWSFYDSEWFHKNSVTLVGHFQNLELSYGLEDHQIFRSRIRPSHEGGGVSYEHCGGVVREFESWVYRIRGQMARSWFCGWLPSIDEEVQKLPLNPELVKKIRSLNESVSVLQKLALEGRASALELSRVAPARDHLMSIEDREQIEAFGKKLQEVEALMSRVIHVEPELRCMLKWYQQMLHNLSGETIAEMAKETIHAFDLVSEGIDLISSYTRKTLERAKPRAVAPTASVTEIKPQ